MLFIVNHLQGFDVAITLMQHNKDVYLASL